MIRFLNILFLLFSFQMHAATVIIKGESNAPNQMVRVIIQKDYVSYLEQTLANSKTDSQGKFELHIDIEQITSVQIALGLDRAEIVLKPGSTYRFKISQPKNGASTSYFEKESIQLIVLESNDGGIQKQIDDINMIFNAFVMQHFNDLYHNRRVDLLDSLKQAIDVRLPAKVDGFVTDYNTFKQATLLQTVRSRSSDQWIKSMFFGKPIVYSNPEYMNLVNEVFRDYFISNRRYQSEALKQAMESSLTGFVGYITNNLLFNNQPQFCELVCLLNLRDLYFNVEYDKERILNLLNQFQQQSLFAEHKQMAANIILEVKYLEYKSVAPAFQLKNAANKVVSGEQLKGKGILLNFIQDSCQACLSGLNDMKNLYDSFKEDYTFITISTADGFNNSAKYFKNNNLNWMLFNLGEDILMLEAYRVKTFPEYIILLKDGTIGMAPAPQPGQNLVYHLNRLRRQ